MYEQEKQRAAHLMILLYKTFFLITLTGVCIFFGWDKGAVVLLFLGLVASWLMHITEKVSETIRLWLYNILTMLAFFYLGIHEEVIYDMTPIMLVFIFVYIVAEERAFIRLCAITYYMTMCYDFVFVIGNPLKLPIEEMLRLLLHFVIIFMAERLAEAVIQRRKKEREKTDERISSLEETNRRAEDFLANVSHELRTPINAVTGITEVLLKKEEDPEKKKDMLAIQIAGNRLFGQIEDILDYTEVDSGRLVVSKENYMIASLINDIIAEHRLILREKELELIFDVDAGVPCVLFGDGRKIKKIIVHLIDNAVKFTKRGGVYIRVYALPKSYGVNLCIKVSDTGVGIAEDELGKIKERFFQSNGGRNRRAGGLGLGLSICYGMVTAMGGFIQLESVEGSGTTVSVSIPQKIVDAAPSMEVPNRADLCIALYLRLEKYEIPEVRDYYNTMITHMVRELDIMVHRVFDLEELKKLADMYRLTHLIIGKEEYEECASYYEALDKGVEVIVVADDHFRPAKNSRVNFVRKPSYCLPIVNILNAQTSFEVEVLERTNMTCPGVRVLVVDDEAMNLIVAEGIFKVYQMEVKTAGSGMEAIELCQKEDFDLIFLDHMMPEMDGVETLKILRKNQADTGKTHPIIAFTANAVSGAREMFLREGFDGFIAKPIKEQELKRLLNKVLPKGSIVYTEPDDRKKLSPKEQVTKAEQVDAQEPVSGNDVKKYKITRLEEKGFHTKTGLQYCHNNSAFYEEMLVLFAKDAGRKITDIEAAFQKEDLENYEIMVHALKSSSKTIGADTLSEMAKEAEDAAKEQDLAYIRGNHERLIDQYQETVQCIFDVLGFAVASPSEKASSEISSETALVNDTEVSKLVTLTSSEELLACLSKLKESLALFDVNAVEDRLAEMSEFVYQGTLVSELLRDVWQDVEDFELSAAAGKVEKLIDSIEDR